MAFEGNPDRRDRSYEAFHTLFRARLTIPLLVAAIGAASVSGVIDRTLKGFNGEAPETYKKPERELHPSQMSYGQLAWKAIKDINRDTKSGVRRLLGIDNDGVQKWEPDR